MHCQVTSLVVVVLVSCDQGLTEDPAVIVLFLELNNRSCKKIDKETFELDPEVTKNVEEIK
jgi:hypothetical protein